MKRLTFMICAAVLALAAANSAASAATLCVGGPGCFPTIQAAVDAAHDGDTVAIAPGTFAGGVTVDVSVDLRGAGANRTIIKGGGPVVTIGEEQADTEPTVSISGVTITGGVNSSFPDHAVTQGGGVRIPQGSFQTRNGLGATVTISDSVISGNKVYSTQLLPPGLCGPDVCSFAGGGGIASLGTLTVLNTRVIDNQSGEPGSLTVVASGGGISAGRGAVTLSHSVVAGNRAIGTPPYGAHADAGGIEIFGPLPATIDDTVVSGNSAELTSTLATNGLGPVAFAGGLHIDDGGSATVTHTIVSGNRANATGTVADLVVGGAGGIDDDGSLVLERSAVEHNQSSAAAPSANATALVGGAMDIDGLATISDSHFIGNSGTADAPAGTAIAGGGAIANFGRTTLERTVVTANSLTANGASGFAQGGGIWSGNPGDGRTPIP